MAMRKSIQLGTIIDQFDLEVLYGPEGYRDRKITIEHVDRPGLQLTGYFDYFDKERIQLIGLVETSYLNGLSAEERERRFDMLFAYHPPAVIFARGLEPYPECMEMAKKHGQVILRTGETTANIMSMMIAYLRTALSPTITRSGVLVEVYGEGVLLAGESGVGKSEIAIELIKRGHRLIADDAVEIRRIPSGGLIGTSPELIRHYMELRGIGVVDVERLFGMSAIKFDSPIDLLINLEDWVEGKIYDRLGAEELFTDLLGVQLRTITIPVKPGRNLAAIVEVAAMNNRNRKMGYNAAKEFAERVDADIYRRYNESGLGGAAAAEEER